MSYRNDDYRDQEYRGREREGRFDQGRGRGDDPRGSWDRDDEFTGRGLRGRDYGDDRDSAREAWRGDQGRSDTWRDDESRRWGSDAGRDGGSGRQSGFGGGGNGWRGDAGREGYGRAFGNGGREDMASNGGRWGSRGATEGGWDNRGGGYGSYGGQNGMGGSGMGGSGMGMGQSSDAGHRGRGPKGYTRGDDRIRDDVNDRLTDDGNVDAGGISVSVQGGTVTLDGTVGSKAEKRAAEDCVDNVSGVKHVQNNLRVSSSSGSGQDQGSTRQSDTGSTAAAKKS